MKSEIIIVTKIVRGKEPCLADGLPAGQLSMYQAKNLDHGVATNKDNGYIIVVLQHFDMCSDMCLSIL